MADGMKFCTVCGSPLADSGKVDLNKPADDPYSMPPAVDPNSADANGIPMDGAADVNGQAQGGQSGQSGQPNFGDPSGQPGYDYDRLNSSYGINGAFDPNAYNNDPSGQQQFGGQQQYGGQQYGGQQYGAPGYGAPMGGMGMGMGMSGLQERSIVTCIILSFVTCGIYGLYWMYALTEDTNHFATDPNPASGGMALLLSIVTCGIYSWYWMYKRGEYIDNYYTQRGLPPQSNSILYLVLSICGLGIVSYCLMQNEINKIARGM